MSEFNIPERRSEYSITSAVISSDRLGQGVLVDIRGVIVQFEIYEHINKPYITAKFFLVDHNDVFEGIDFLGGEKLEVSIQHSEDQSTAEEIKKDFLIDKIDFISKTDERTESVVIHCTEFHVYASSLQNVSRCYKGSPSSMIQKILDEYLDKSLAIVGDDDLNNLKVIVPNMHPLEACMWIKNRVTTRDGLPFYFFSALGLDNLVLKDLQTMLTQVPINIDSPFIYAPSINATQSEFPKFYTIEEFTIASTDDLLSLIRSGVVGASYEFYNTSTGLPTPVKFNVDDVFKNLSQQQALGGNNSRYVFGPEYKLNDKQISTYESKLITQISSIGAYSSRTSFRSYNEELTEGGHRKKINAAALTQFLAKSPIEITVRAREFITGDRNYTIGKTIRVVFLDNSEGDQTAVTFDTKKSADYIICAAKHSFMGEKAVTQLICGKLGYFGQEFEL